MTSSKNLRDVSLPYCIIAIFRSPSSYVLQPFYQKALQGIRGIREDQNKFSELCGQRQYVFNDHGEVWVFPELWGGTAKNELCRYF